MLVVRLLAATQSPTVGQDAFTFLHAARKVTFLWLNKLLVKLENAEAESQILDYQERVCEMAAICRSTYDVEPAHLGVLFLDPDSFSTFVTCSVNLYDNHPPNLKKSRGRLQTLLFRDRRIAREALPVIIQNVISNPQLLGHVVLQLWPDYCASSTGWTTLPDLNSGWVSTLTAGKEAQRVHLNLLEGRLLIDGKPLGRLPREYTSHPSYRRLFGQVRLH